MKKGIRKILVFTVLLLLSAISYGGRAEAATSAKLVNGTLTISGTGKYEDRTYEKSNEVRIIRVEEKVNELGSFVFSGCKNLTSVSFPTSLTKIGYETFRNCTLLENVTLPSNLRAFNTGSFENCTSLKSIVIPATVTEISVSAFDKGVTLYGAYNSAASKYASENGNPFVVKFKEAKYLEVDAIKIQKHTGKAVTPVVTVKDGNNKLVVNKNYKVTYSNNINPGTAAVTVTGCDGYYVGSIQTKFQIAAKKGKTYTVGKLKYKVTNDSTNKKGTVSVKGLAKNSSTISIPKTVKIGSYTYKVTGIEKKAFYKKSKLKKITISSTAIKKMDSKAFTGIHKKLLLRFQNQKKKSYKNLLYKAGIKKNMKIN